MEATVAAAGDETLDPVRATTTLRTADRYPVPQAARTIDLFAFDDRSHVRTWRGLRLAWGRRGWGSSARSTARDYRVGYGLGVLDTESLRFELGVDAHRREGPLEGGADAGSAVASPWAGSHGPE